MSVFLSSPPWLACLPGEQRWQDELILSCNTFLCLGSIALPSEMGMSALGRWMRRQWGVLPSHLSSLKAAHHWGNRKINIDSAANLCIHHLCYTGSFVLSLFPTLTMNLLARLNKGFVRRGDFRAKRHLAMLNILCVIQALWLLVGLCPVPTGPSQVMQQVWIFGLLTARRDIKKQFLKDFTMHGVF